MKTLYGNAVVGQSGGPTSAINATLSGVVRGAMQNSGIAKLYGMKNGMEGLLREDLVDLSAFFGASRDKLRLLEQTPAAALGSCRMKLPEPCGDPAFYERLIAIFRKYDIRYFFYIGGNDSMDTVAKISAYLETADYEMRVVGIPKTVDNDLVGTDHAPGYGSAARFIAVTVSEILRDCAVYRVPAVTIVELMGRDAGWLTAATALGRCVGDAEPDLIYLPERVFDPDRFLSDTREALRRHPNVVVAVSEGVRLANGHYVGESGQSGAVDIFGHSYLAGVGKVLEALVRARIGCKVRSIELSLPQRCGAHIASLTDLRESVGVGRAAVRAATQGKSGVVMSIRRVSDEPYRVTYGSNPISTMANHIRHVDDAFINAAGNHVTDACCAYLFPLIQGEVRPICRGGIPEHLVI